MFMKSSDIYLSDNIFRTYFQKEICRKIWYSGNNQQSTVVVKVANYIRRMATLFEDKWSESFNTALANYIIAGLFRVRLLIKCVVQKIWGNVLLRARMYDGRAGAIFAISRQL